MDSRQAAAYAADTGGIEPGIQGLNLRGRPRSLGGTASLPPPTDNKEGKCCAQLEATLAGPSWTFRLLAAARCNSGFICGVSARVDIRKMLWVCCNV